MTDFVEIHHDPFARCSIIRRVVKENIKPCKCCDRPARFEYGSQSDEYGAQPQFDGVAFCSIDCRRAYVQ